MGCDIHMVTEVRGAHGFWIQPEPFAECGECKGTGAGNNGRCYWCAGKGKLTRYRGRNYTVFSILANVRNRDGEYALPSISDGRGFPEDATVYEDEEGMGDHSFTWCSLAEILAYDWQAEMPVSGWVSAEEFKVFEKDGRPKEWSGGVGGGRVEHVSNERMREVVAGVNVNPTRSYYTEIKWSVRRADYCGEFLRFVEALKALAAEKNLKPEDVRLVFGFDS